MLRTSFVPRSYILLGLCLLLAGLAPVRAEVKMLTPGDGEILIGPTTFSFAVEGPSLATERIDVYVDGVLAGSAVGPDWSFDWEAPPGLADVKIVALALVDGVARERLEARTADVALDEVMDVVSVELFPVVFDERGRYVADLDRDDFVVLDRGMPVELASFSREPTSLHVAVLIDTSDSMKTKLSAVQSASADFVSALDEKDELAVYAFDQSVRTVSEWGADRGRTRSSIRSLRAGGTTALFDAVVHVNDSLADRRGRKVIVVFSDGQDERSIASLEAAVASSESSNTIVYTIASGQTRKDLEARDDLRRLARDAGGQSYEIVKLRDLAGVFGEILEDLRSQYSLAFSPRLQEPGVHAVRVRVDKPGHTVRCRTSYRVGRQD